MCQLVHRWSNKQIIAKAECVYCFCKYIRDYYIALLFLLLMMLLLLVITIRITTTILLLLFIINFCMVFTITYLKEAMFLGFIVLQLFGSYNFCYV